MSFNEQEIALLPEKYRPLSAWAYFWYGVLFAIPIVGIIFLIIFSVSDANINRRSFARSYFCALILVCVIFGISLLMGGFASLASLIASS